MTPADSRYLRNASFFCSVACGGYAREGSEGQSRRFGANETARNREPEDAARAAPEGQEALAKRRFDTKRASHFWTAPWTFLLSTEAGAPDFASFDAAARRCLGRLAPSAAVRGAVNGFLSLGPWGLLDLSRRTVGVHVRGTDHETFHDGAGKG